MCESPKALQTLMTHTKASIERQQRFLHRFEIICGVEYIQKTLQSSYYDNCVRDFAYIDTSRYKFNELLQYTDCNFSICVDNYLCSR